MSIDLVVLNYIADCLIYDCFGFRGGVCVLMLLGLVCGLVVCFRFGLFCGVGLYWLLFVGVLTVIVFDWIVVGAC